MYLLETTFKLNQFRINLNEQAFVKFESDRRIADLGEKVDAFFGANQGLARPKSSTHAPLVFPCVWLKLNKESFESLNLETAAEHYMVWDDDGFANPGAVAEIKDRFSAETDTIWRKAKVVVFSLPDGHFEYRIIVDSYMVFIDMRERKMLINEPWLHTEKLDEFIEFSSSVVDEVIGQYKQLLESNTYYDNLGVPDAYRNGYILQKDLWAHESENGGSEELLSQFAAIKERTKEPAQEVVITRSAYLDAMHVCLKAIRPEANEMSAIEAYRRFADGRDEGLLEIEDTPQAFVEWSKRRYADTSHAEIVPTSSKSTCVWLFANVNEEGRGYYYLSSSISTHLKNEVITMALALDAAGIPFVMSNPDEFEESLRGEELIVFVSLIEKTFDKRYFTRPCGYEDKNIADIHFMDVEEALERGVPIKLYGLDE
ncbi:hypothetical protein [Vibrio mediterranei]|uniref:hypothetical protein n=1 Tax=Vibrio mediterranei TaxID=689 RepID=UPI0040694B8A